MMIARLN